MAIQKQTNSTILSKMLGEERRMCMPNRRKDNQPRRNSFGFINRVRDICPKWINDYASTQVIRELKSQLDESRTRVLQILKDNGYEDDAVYQLLEEKL